ncbi:hypothetical protein BSZ35_10740 [Salinibacter sp. 10B]|uniref:hypothetical protein n=1 Tax=Salinibacter sp. 10B TaxID=1923971 RepID=UPI000CF47F70|nr:hypothetical protein [Salinibacter sp. 10B]PQJ35011.1 hypothetical protein BSZ35_10740 [Salinibacter sp. 10B]
MEATERVDILAALSRRYREAYGDRLEALYALPRNPFEPEEEHEGKNLDIVVVLRGVDDHFAETDGVVEVAMEIEREYDFEYGIFPHHASEDDDFVRVAREEGVRL